jgi:hypothetical protein
MRDLPGTVSPYHCGYTVYLSSRVTGGFNGIQSCSQRYGDVFGYQ